MIRTPTIIAFFNAYCAELEASQAMLDRLDAVAGDGDHGATMVMGMREVVAALSGSEQIPGDALRVAAEAFGSVGGSIGPLLGTALIRAARAVGGEVAITDDALPRVLQAATDGIRDRGRSQVGDKTLLDVMQPATTALTEQLVAGSTARAALEQAVATARTALAQTAEIPARRGRARRLAERALGSVDPGAASAALAWETAGRLAGITG